MGITFDEVLAQVLELLQREGRVSYRALKRRFAVDDEYLEDLKAEIIDSKQLAFDEEGKVLVWRGKGEKEEETGKRRKAPLAPRLRTPDSELRTFPDAGLHRIWPIISGPNRPPWKPAALAMVNAKPLPLSLPTSRIP